MAELTPIPSAQRPADPGYQPVSGYAVGAIVAAGFFAVTLTVLIYSALTTRQTPFEIWPLMVAAIGWVLAVVGRSHIRNSEGTRTGLRLTAAAWWVCVLGGAAFLAFLYANKVVLRKKSEQEAAAFLDHLKAGRVERAYLLTLPTGEWNRGPVDDPEEFAKAYEPTGYPTFLQTDVVRLVRRYPEATVEYLSSKDVGQDDAGFTATHLYRLNCPEGRFDIHIKLTGTEPQRGGPPQWRIPAMPAPNFTLTNTQLTQYGRLRTELEAEGMEEALKWMRQLTMESKQAEAHLPTLPRADRDRALSVLQGARLLIGGLSGSFPLPPELLPGNRNRPQPKGPFDDLVDSGFFMRDADGGAIPAERLARLRELWPTIVITPPGASRRSGMLAERPEPGTLTADATAITLVVPAEIAQPNSSTYYVCTVGLVCTEPGVVAALEGARQRGLTTMDDASVTLRTVPRRDWRIAWIRTTMEPQAPPGASGPGGPKGDRKGPPG